MLFVLYFVLEHVSPDAGLENLPLNADGRGLRLTKDDWDTFTCGRRYLDPGGEMGRKAFVTCMRLELNSYAHRTIAGSMNDKAKQGSLPLFLLT